MKNIFANESGRFFSVTLGLVSAGLLSGCANWPQPEDVQVDSVPVYRDVDPNVGFVEVFNSTDVAPFGNFFRKYPQTGCRIYDAAGKQVAFVPAQETNSVKAPPTVRIAAGHYKIVTETKNRGEVTIPLLVLAGRTAVVNLGVDPSR